MTVGIRRLPVRKFTGAKEKAARDDVIEEEPLEIRVRSQKKESSLGYTMRTPGSDLELAIGTLVSEGILRRPHDVVKASRDRNDRNVVRVDLSSNVAFDAGAVHRHGVKSSACGVCGRATLESLALRGLPTPKAGDPKWDVATLGRLPDQLRKRQALFQRTGGLHAAARVDRRGKVLMVREDVGRHNAVDKLVGAAFTAGLIPLHEELLLVSGRAGYEIVQKAASAGFAGVAAVGAPTTLAIEVADAFGLTLAGFLGRQGANVYCHPERLAPA